MKIAVVAVGYADGYRRSLGNGNGGVYINGEFCKTIGRVCMDMIMVDIQDMDIQEGDQVEIIGEHLSLLDFAGAIDSIPYEVMTSLSARMPRVFVDG
jgi:alanine racemase